MTSINDVNSMWKEGIITRGDASILMIRAMADLDPELMTHIGYAIVTAPTTEDEWSKTFFVYGGSFTAPASDEERLERQSAEIEENRRYRSGVEVMRTFMWAACDAASREAKD